MLWGTNVLKVEVTKPCSKCGIVQPLSQYAIARKNDDGTYGYRSDCKTCTKKLNQIRTRLRKQNPLPSSDYCCPICGRTEEELKASGQFSDRTIWAADHDHETNKFRAYLCNICNQAIGRLGDDTELLLGAYKYLTEYVAPEGPLEKFIKD